MAIPDFQSIMRPLLALLADGQTHSISDIHDALCAHFGLSQDEIKERIASGTQTIMRNRVGWARTYLNKAGLLSIPQRAHAMITDRGRQVLAECPERVDVRYLKRFDEGRPLSFFHFDYVLGKLLRPAPTHTQCGAGGGYVAVTPDGELFPCFELVVEKENCIGSLAEGFDPAKRRRFQRMHADARTGCRDCWLRYHCGGGCHAFNIRYNRDIHLPYRPYCEFARHRFELAAWILSEIAARGPRALKRLQAHLKMP